MMRRIGFRVIPSSGLACVSRRFTSTDFDEASVIAKVKSRAMFTESAIEKAVSRFISGLTDSSYGRCYSEDEVAAHVHGYLCAKASSAIGGRCEYSLMTEDSAFFISKKDESSQLRAVRGLAKFVADVPKDKVSISVRGYSTDEGDMCVYTARLLPFVNPDPKPGEKDIKQLASKLFLEQRSPELQERYQSLLNRFHGSVVPVYTVLEGKDGEVCFSVAMEVERTSLVASLLAVIQEIPGAVVLRNFSETFSNGVHIYTFYIRGATALQLEERASMVGLLPNRPTNSLTRLHENHQLNADQTVYADAAIIFAFYFTPHPTNDDYRHLRAIVAKEPNGVNRLNNLRTSLSLEMMSERYIGTLIAFYPEFMTEIFEDFRRGTAAESRNAIREKIAARFKEDQRTTHDFEIFNSFLRFNEVVLKHNFFKTDKVALAFRLNPTFLEALEYPRVPHGVFILAGSQWRGFHIRFTDIARGGIRMIISKENAYRKNKRTVFQENYNLALTQHLKNKDIPEGGSKGTILVSSRHLNKFNQASCRSIFLQYVDALLDVILPNETGIVDHYGKPEILFLGPDENTAGTFPSVGALHSKRRNFSAWKSLTTGKDADMGGIPHDKYGMTTRSVRAMVRGVYKKLGLDESKMTKFSTGGPDGDLGSNEILQSREVVLGMSDISASIHDPSGLDRDELLRLAKARQQLRHYNRSKLSAKGFIVTTDDKNVKLPDGTVVADGTAFRDEFYLSKYSDAEVFVTCGGRPRSVTLDNVGRFLKVPEADGEGMLAGRFEGTDKLKYRIIVEGANLFISHDARLALERCGVVLIKDASANKGGVTSSSLEVYAGLALSDEEHAKHMCAKDANNPPEFYQNYVNDIIERIENNANREFEAIWRDHEKHPKMPKTLIADSLSEKNVQVRASILASDVFKDEQLKRYILLEYTPKSLLKLVPVDVIMKRVPEEYLRAICAMWLASEYVYGCGMDSNEFEFFTFMSNHMKRAAELGNSK